MAKNSSGSGLSRKTIVRRVVLLAVLLLAAASIAYPKPLNWVIGRLDGATGWHIPAVNTPFVLGLDLQGGTRLEYSADVSKVDPSQQSGALDGVRDVIERRVNAMGVAEPLVQTAQAGNDWRVSVELAGVRDVNQAIKMIGETPILQFKEQNDQATTTLTADQKKQMDDANAKADKTMQDILAQALKNPAGFATLAASTTQYVTTSTPSGDLGFIKDNPMYSDIFDSVKGDAAGTVHPTLVQTPSYDAVVKVAEVKPAGTEMNASHILISFAGATNSSSTSTKEQALQLIQSIKKQATPKNFADLAKKYSQDGTASEGGSLGWFGKGVMVQAFEDAAFKLQKGQISDVVETQFGYHLILKNDERPLNDVHVLASIIKRTQESDIAPQDQFKDTGLTGKDLTSAALDFDQRSGAPEVSLVFNDAGAKLFSDITKRNIGKDIAIYLDGQPISVATVQTQITNGQAVINGGSFTVQSAKLLAQRLNAGALPIPITLIAQQSVGPTLGMDSVNASLIAGLWGFAFVALFMLLLYRLPGLTAITALSLYVAISMSVFKLLPVTLSLSGIAGFILSLGIAVDANVLIFERLKEELRAGKPLKLALEEAFKRAWPSIRDGNTTTLISCAVLYWFTSSVIKGFALTLAIGVLLSMFSAIVATRAILRFIAGFSWAEHMSWLFPGASSSSSSQK